MRNWHPTDSCWHHRYAQARDACTVLLIAAGGMVTSTGSGLSVPDWPTTYGWNMFTFPLSKWVGGIRYEHSHRLIASTVGFLTIILAVWTWRVEPRALGAALGFAALGAVILQGLLGGLTVLLLPAAGGLDRPRGPCADLLLPHGDARAGHVAGLEERRDRRLTTRCSAGIAVADDGARLHADPPRRDDAAHTTRGWRFRTFRWRSGTSLPPDLECADRDSLRASRRRAGRDDRRCSRPPRTCSTTTAQRASWCVRLRSCCCCVVRSRSRSARSSIWSRQQPDHQHRARRQRRAGARHLARVDAAQRSARGSSDRCSRSAARPLAPDPMRRTAGGAAMRVGRRRAHRQPRARSARLRRARQAAAELPRRGVGAGRLRDGGRRARSALCGSPARCSAPGSSPAAPRRSTRCIERDPDALMRRTRLRPLPDQRAAAARSGCCSGRRSRSRAC